jgi:hypothetical protein
MRQAISAGLPEIFAALTDAERQYLAECVEQGELMFGREFEAKYSVPCPGPTNHYHYGMKDASLLTIFIHVPRDRSDPEYGIVPEFVEPLRAWLPKPPPLQAHPETDLPATFHFKHRWRKDEEDRPIQVYESERVAPFELVRVLRVIQAGRVKVTDSGRRPTEVGTRVLAEALLVPDFALDPPPEGRNQSTELSGPVRAHAWGVLAQQCGWAKCRGGALTLTKEGQCLLERFQPEFYRLGVSRFFDDNNFDELNRVNHIRGQSGKGKRWMSDPGMRKRGVKLGLAKFPVGQWLALAELRRLIVASGASWNVLDADRPALYFEELQYGWIGDTDELNRQFLRVLAMESLATLGVVDIAYVHPHNLWPEFGGHWGVDELSFCGRYDGLLYVRLNPLGAYALSLTDAYELRLEAKPKLFHVLPNLELVLMNGPLNPADRATLELVAAPKADLVWTLDSERMLTHVETGGTFRELRDFLEGNAAEALPDNVIVFLGELEDKLGACRTRRDGVLLEWADPALALLIATSTGMNKLCFHAGGNWVAVPKANLNAFSRSLKKLGYVLPRGDAGC